MSGSQASGSGPAWVASETPSDGAPSWAVGIYGKGEREWFDTQADAHRAVKLLNEQRGVRADLNTLTRAWDVATRSWKASPPEAEIRAASAMYDAGNRLVAALRGAGGAA